MPKEKDISPLLSAEKLSAGYSWKKERVRLLEEINFDIHRGELLSLIGPNGAGKTTLIRTLTGLQPSLGGNIYLQGDNIAQLNNFYRARKIGIVLTDSIAERNLSVQELVGMGRYTYTNWYGQLSTADKDIIAQSIHSVGLTHKTKEPLFKLSDGEKQRALIAKVLAQDVDLIILDEPTAHLDLVNKVEVLGLLRKFALEMNKGILMSTHELELALQVSDRLALIRGDHSFVAATPEDLIVSGDINSSFGSKHIQFRQDSASFELLPEQGKCAFVKGEGVNAECVKRICKRYGFSISSKVEQAVLKVELSDGKYVVEIEQKKSSFTNFEDLQLFVRNNSQNGTR